MESVADEGRLEVPRVQQLSLDPKKIPGRSAEDALLLERMDILVPLHPVRNARQALSRPSAGFANRRHRFREEKLLEPILSPVECRRDRTRAVGGIAWREWIFPRFSK